MVEGILANEKLLLILEKRYRIKTNNGNDSFEIDITQEHMMDITVRIKRILSCMERFSFSSGYDEELGEVIGVYDNQPESDSLSICRNGIFWSANNERISIKYGEIANLNFVDPKQSIFIKVEVTDKKNFNLPVRGVRGNFMDVMEFFRFLKRVVSDIHGSKVDN